MVINRRIFAVLYYNVLEANSYDLSLQQDRKNALNNFRKAIHIDEQALEKAHKSYQDLVSQDYQSIVSSKKIHKL